MRSIELLTKELLSLPSISRALLAEKLIESLEGDKIICLPMLPDVGLCDRSHISLADLVIGVKVSADSDRLGLLGWLQEEVKSQCAIA